MFRVVVAGLGIQGPKRIAAAGADVVATVDLVKPAEFKELRDVPLDSYDAALLCVPDGAKAELLMHLAANGKHALVEKPFDAAPDDMALIERTARENRAVLYTAYNHRFEPHFVNMRDLIASGKLGAIYRLRIFYGNGTARLVRDNPWRDTGAGVLTDLGSHLLDTVDFWLGQKRNDFRVVSARRFENKAPDHVMLLADGEPQIELEMTLLSWRNHFVAEVFGEHGLATISSLCKWGPSTFTFYRRLLPAGRPPEEAVTLVQHDPTWAAEYQHFKALCQGGTPSDLAKDRWIGSELHRLSASATEFRS